MPLSSKFLSETTIEISCENWLIFSEDMNKMQ